MKLTLRNKKQYEVTDSSIKTAIVLILPNYGEIDKITPNLTEDNFKGATLGDEILENVVPMSIAVSGNLSEENITVTVSCRVKSDVELLQSQVTELQEIVADLGGM